MKRADGGAPVGKREDGGRTRHVVAYRVVRGGGRPLGGRRLAALREAEDAPQGGPDQANPNHRRLGDFCVLTRHLSRGEGNAALREPAPERDGRRKLRLLPLPRHARVRALFRRLLRRHSWLASLQADRLGDPLRGRAGRAVLRGGRYRQGRGAPPRVGGRRQEIGGPLRAFREPGVHARRRPGTSSATARRRRWGRTSPGPRSGWGWRRRARSRWESSPPWRASSWRSADVPFMKKRLWAGIARDGGSLRRQKGHQPEDNTLPTRTLPSRSPSVCLHERKRLRAASGVN